ncbi:MAG: c-type cytochrome domain-containing protein [Pirellulaceae bacterium]
MKSPGFSVSSPWAFRLCFALLMGSLLISDGFAQQQLTRQQTRKVRQIEAGIERAARLYQNQNYEASAKLIQQFNDELQELTKDAPTRELIAAVQPLHQKLREAREALVGSGASLSVIPDLPDAVMQDGSVAISFSQDIAPLLATNCGRCHIGRNRGEFSMATFQALADGLGGSPVIVPGKPDESYLVELIEQGDMPPQGQVPEADVEKIKKWIADGAAFDGQSLDQNIGEIARAAAQAQNPNAAVMRPAGNETISFAIDVAPVIVDNCMGCHYQPQNVRGGLRMTNFNQLLRGGDSGSMINTGKADESLLIQRLTATDNTRMPRGRRPLPPEVIEKIKTWINEGARFDGQAAGLNLRDVNGIAVAQRATHDELMADRQTRVLRNWNTVMSGAESGQVTAGEVFVIGTENNRWLNELGDFSDQAAGQLKRALEIDRNEPLVKGQIALFAFDRRYDYSEFGKMVEQRDLPREWRSHWGYDTVDAYIAALVDSDGFDDRKPELMQRIAALAVASMASDVPHWFADGMGYALTNGILKDKELEDRWVQQSIDAFRNSENGDDFMNGRLPEDQAGLVAFNFARGLLGSRNNDLMKVFTGMRNGKSFAAAFRDEYELSPQELWQNNTGGLRRGGNRNRRGNR